MKNDLDLTLENLEFEMEECLASIFAAHDARSTDGEAVHALCTTHRRLGIGLLLSSLDLDGFHQQLRSSGRAYAFLLRTARQGYKSDPYHLCRSRAQPLWDALAADDLRTAREIASLAPTSWSPSLEDESDYRYLDLIMLLLTGAEDASLKAKLDAFQQSLQGTTALLPRYELCVALVQGRPPALEVALRKLVDAHREDFEELIRADTVAPEDAQTQAFVCVEAIALVKLARLRGVAAPGAFPLVPDVTLAPAKPAPEQDDPWRSLGPH